MCDPDVEVHVEEEVADRPGPRSDECRSDEGTSQASGLIGSVIGAIVALLIWRAMNDRRGVR